MKDLVQTRLGTLNRTEFIKLYIKLLTTRLIKAGLKLDTNIYYTIRDNKPMLKVYINYNNNSIARYFDIKGLDSI